MFDMEEFIKGLRAMLIKDIDTYIKTYFTYLQGKNDAIKINQGKIITLNLKNK